MKTQELRQLTLIELGIKEREFLQEEFKLRFGHATGQLAKTHRLKELRRIIARIKTIMREKEGAS
jgi:large subunit ribosomal protein L29